MEVNLAYYRQRAAEEAAAAERSENEAARSAHLELARLYTERVEELESDPGPAGIRLVAAK